MMSSTAKALSAKLQNSDEAKSASGSSKLFWFAVLFTGVFSAWSLINPSSLTSTLWGWVYKFHGHMNWFTILIPISFFGICMFLAISKFGKIKLGGKDSKPEFSTFSWIAMLFTAGIGVGLVNFGVAEPMVHYL